MPPDWWNKAVRIWVDQERGLYPWPGKAPRDGNGDYRVVKNQILIDCGKDTNQREAKRRIWENPVFLEMLDEERRRRDTAIVSVVREIEAVSGPLIELRTKMQEHVQDIFAAGPGEDEDQLSAKDYVSQALPWCRYIDELTGRTKTQEEEAIQNIVGDLAEANKITAGIAKEVLALSQQYNEQLADVIDGQLDE